MLKIKAKEVRHLGYLQGFKVYIDGVKYPRRHGYWYTHLRESAAKLQAVLEYKYGVVAS